MLISICIAFGLHSLMHPWMDFSSNLHRYLFRTGERVIGFHDLDLIFMVTLGLIFYFI